MDFGHTIKLYIMENEESLIGLIGFICFFIEEVDAVHFCGPHKQVVE